MGLSSNRGPDPWRVDLRLGPSRIFRCLSFSLHAAALLAVGQADIAWAWRCLLWGVVMLSALLSWRGTRADDGIVVREQIDRWWLETPRHVGAAELAGFQVWRYLVVMRFRGRDARGRRWRARVVVWPDAVSADAFRRLRVRLRHGLHRRAREEASV